MAIILKHQLTSSVVCARCISTTKSLFLFSRNVLFHYFLPKLSSPAHRTKSFHENIHNMAIILSLSVVADSKNFPTNYY